MSTTPLPDAEALREAVARTIATVAGWPEHSEHYLEEADALLAPDGPLAQALGRRDAEHAAEISDYEHVLASKRENARAIDVALHGEDGAAAQPSLCDLIEPARRMRERAEAAEAMNAALTAERDEARELHRQYLNTPVGRIIADRDRLAANLLDLAKMYGEACRDLVGEYQGHRSFARAYGDLCQEREQWVEDYARLAVERDALVRALDAAWRKVVAYRMPQPCKHFVAANMLSDMEALGFLVPTALADAVVNADDETALAHAPLAFRAALTEPSHAE